MEEATHGTSALETRWAMYYDGGGVTRTPPPDAATMITTTRTSTPTRARDRPVTVEPSVTPPSRPLTPARADSGAWSSSLTKLTVFGTVQSFWASWSIIPPPTSLSPGANLYLFREMVHPAWEDPENRLGGRWTLSLPPSQSARGRGGLLNELWMETAIACVGEQLGTGVCGCVAGRRRGSGRERIAVWVRDAGRPNDVIAVGRAWRDVMKIPDALTIEFTPHNPAPSATAGSYSPPRPMFTI